MERYVPVDAIVEGKFVTWYIDVDCLNVTDLIKLKKEIEEYSQVSVGCIDGLVMNDLRLNLDSMREMKRERKASKIKKKHFNKKIK